MDHTKPARPQRTPARLNRRSAIVAAMVATIAGVTNSPAPTAPAEPSPMHLSDPISPAWAAWRGAGGDNLGDLLDNMVTETAVATYHPAMETERQLEDNRLTRIGLDEVLDRLDTIHVRMAGAGRDQALALGFALAMTRDQAPMGPEAWYQAALRYAGIVIPSAAEQKIAYGKLGAAVDENWRLHGYRRIDESDSSQPGLTSATDVPEDWPGSSTLDRSLDPILAAVSQGLDALNWRRHSYVSNSAWVNAWNQARFNWIVSKDNVSAVVLMFDADIAERLVVLPRKESAAPLRPVSRVSAPWVSAPA